MSKRKPSGQPGRATIRDVAARAGVSVATVSRVLSSNYHVSEELRGRVMTAVRELDYVTNAHARSLSGTGRNIVGILLDDMTGAAFAHVARGVEEEASARGWLSMVCATNSDPERELELVNLMRQQGAAAVFLLGGTYDLDEYRLRMARFARSLDAAGSRLVLCGRPPLDDDVPATVIEYDNERGAYAMTGHLLSSGHRRILIMPGPEGFTTAEGRLAGYRQALAEHGVPFDPELVMRPTFVDTVGRHAIRKALQDGLRFTAVFCATDIVAAGVLDGLREAGLSVPEDVSVVGFDDIPLASYLWPPLTTVHVPYEEMGRVAMRLVADPRRDAAEHHVVMGTHLVVRRSVLPVRRPDGPA